VLTSLPYRSPRVYSRTFALTLVVLCLAGIAGGCGGGSSTDQPVATVGVSGSGFVFRAPAGREILRTERTVSVQPRAAESPELESVTRYPLIKPFRPTLWPGVVTELDGSMDKLAAGLEGTIESAEDVRVAGRRGRRYEIAYARDGKALRERITFVFRSRVEFQLLCRYAEPDGPPVACDLLEQTFRLA
jgi:hypothetical protein